MSDLDATSKALATPHAFPRVPVWRRVSLLSGNVAIGVFIAFNNYTLSSWLFGITSSLFLISIFGNSKSLEGAILSPWFGALSDRTWLGWLGRRRPFVLAGGVLSGLLLGFTPQIAHFIEVSLGGVLSEQQARTVPALIVIFLFTMTFNLMDDQYRTLLPDLFADDEQNKMSSYMVVAEYSAQMCLLFLFAYLLRGSSVIPDWTFAVTGAIVFAASMIVVITIEEPSPASWDASRGLEAGPGRTSSPWATIAHYPSAIIFLVGIFAYWAGVNAVLPLITIFVETILGADKGEAQLLPALMLLSTLLFAVPVAYLGNSIGKRPVIGNGYVIMTITAIGGMLITTKEQGMALFLFAGAGNAAVIVLSLPLLVDLIPRNHMGAAVGLMAAATSVAAPLSSLVGGALSEQFGPRAVFWIMFAMALLALLLLPWVRQTVSTAAALTAETAKGPS